MGQNVSTVLHQFSRKFRFNRLFKKLRRLICCSLALQKLDLVENFAVTDFFVLNRYSTVFINHRTEPVIENMGSGTNFKDALRQVAILHDFYISIGW